MTKMKALMVHQRVCAAIDKIVMEDRVKVVGIQSKNQSAVISSLGDCSWRSV